MVLWQQSKGVTVVISRFEQVEITEEEVRALMIRAI